MKGIARENSVTEPEILLNSEAFTQPGSIVLLQYSTETLNLAKVSEVFLPIILNS